MTIDLASDPAFAKAVAEGVRAAFLDPEFRRALVNDVVAGFVWLTRTQVAEIYGKTPQTIKKWAEKNKITVSTAMGETEPLYLLQSLQEAMQSGAIRARKASPKSVQPAVEVAASPRGIQPLRSVGRLPRS